MADRESPPEELRNPETLERLDYCQIPEACIITREGVELPDKNYGWQNLYETDKIRGWFDEESLPVFKESMEHMMKIAPD